MSFEWRRIHKWEDNIENQVTESVYDYVFEYYGVTEVTELTEDQIKEIEDFRDELNEYSPMQWGFSNLINNWESEKWEEENE